MGSHTKYVFNPISFYSHQTFSNLSIEVFTGGHHHLWLLKIATTMLDTYFLESISRRFSFFVPYQIILIKRYVFKYFLFYDQLNTQ